jgi:hypothetical protein
MKNATVLPGYNINSFELILACEDFETHNPDIRYEVRQGNNCIWISFGMVHMYYIFRDGKIVDVQVD